MVGIKFCMKCVGLALFIVAWGGSMHGQVPPSTESLKHIRAILGSSPEDSLFLQMMLDRRLAKSPDQDFITHRDLLDPFCVSICAHDSVVIHDTLADGKAFFLAIYTETFEPDSHVYEYFPGEDSLIETIDERPAYGAVDQVPATRVDSMVIRLEGRELMIPRSAYRSFYDLNLCQMEYFLQPVMVYPSQDERFFYLYLYGGEGAGTYFAKLVFDHERYLTRIVAEYSILRQSGAIRPEFIGF